MGEGRPAFGPTCTEFVYPECQHFDFANHGTIFHRNHFDIPKIVLSLLSFVVVCPDGELTLEINLIRFRVINMPNKLNKTGPERKLFFLDFRGQVKVFKPIFLRSQESKS